ncbi:MAG: cobyric acid synthase [Dehalococcoidales bacterium]|nr:cobyric acid synthase [Dehalococcoidales bacterium]
MPGKVLMVQGTASSVGKSVLVAAFCRIFRQDGYKVAPFKAQNMALNSFVTREGGEIGRAQAVQAEAAGIEPSVDMNPVLLKPEADAKSQVIVSGKVMKTLRADKYYEYTPRLLKIIEDSLKRLRRDYDIVVIEGAGSPAEVNLKRTEIVNMRIARLAKAPVLLVGDIDRGGVFAFIVGTLALLNPQERKLVKGLVINKFRGDISLLKSGLDFLEQKTGKPVLGVVPYFRDIVIAQEDSVYLDERIAKKGGGLNIAVIRLPHISNYDDFDPLEAAGCRLSYITKPEDLTDADLIILPGTKSTMADLAFLRRQQLDKAIIRQAKKGTPVIGICGGYQMMGKIISDPSKVESSDNITPGLGLLDINTEFVPEKKTTQVKAKVAADSGLLAGLKGTKVTGYEIHMGQTAGKKNPVLRVIKTPQGIGSYFDGAVNKNGRVFGSYLHGLFHNAEFMQGLVNNLQKMCGISTATPELFSREEQYDRLADLVRQNLDMKKVYEILRSE